MCNGKTIPLNKDTEHLIISAERYSVGRRTYISKQFCDTVKPLLPDLSDWCLTILNNDFLSVDRQTLDGKWGDECDRLEWGEFWNALLDEIQKRITKGTWRKGEDVCD